METIGSKTSRCVLWLLAGGALAGGCVAGDEVEEVVAAGVTADAADAAEACNPRWINLPLQLDTDPLTPSPYANNVDTAYLESIFTVDPQVKLVIEGSFPMVRFMSVQTGAMTSTKDVTGFLPDYEFVMDEGSVNPFVEGNPIGGSPREYTLEILPPGAASSAPNQIALPEGTAERQMILIRYYSPDAGVTITAADIPRVSARDVATDEPAACPEFQRVPEVDEVPAWLSGLTGQPGPAITFAAVSCGAGCNAAVPAYLYAQPRLYAGQVAVVRFRAPTFIDTSSGAGTFPDPAAFDTRYWSMTVVDPTSSMAVNGLVDTMATPAGGQVTMVLGSDSRLKAIAQRRGQNFVQDLRAPAAMSAGLVYRNLVPSSSFWPEGADYPQAYWPRGVVCNVREYLADSASCRP